MTTNMIVLGVVGVVAAMLVLWKTAPKTERDFGAPFSGLMTVILTLALASGMAALGLFLFDTFHKNWITTLLGVGTASVAVFVLLLVFHRYLVAVVGGICLVGCLYFGYAMVGSVVWPGTAAPAPGPNVATTVDGGSQNASNVPAATAPAAAAAADADANADSPEAQFAKLAGVPCPNKSAPLKWAIIHYYSNLWFDATRPESKTFWLDQFIEGVKQSRLNWQDPNAPDNSLSFSVDVSKMTDVPAFMEAIRPFVIQEVLEDQVLTVSDPDLSFVNRRLGYGVTNEAKHTRTFMQLCLVPQIKEESTDPSHMENLGIRIHVEGDSPVTAISVFAPADPQELADQAAAVVLCQKLHESDWMAVDFERDGSDASKIVFKTERTPLLVQVTTENTLTVQLFSNSGKKDEDGFAILAPVPINNSHAAPASTHPQAGTQLAPVQIFDEPEAKSRPTHVNNAPAPAAHIPEPAVTAPVQVKKAHDADAPHADPSRKESSQRPEVEAKPESGTASRSDAEPLKTSAGGKAGTEVPAPAARSLAVR